jgi:acyl carrier protein
MTDEKAFEMILQALEKACPGASKKATLESHLTEEKIIDSLDSMSFLFELEQMYGSHLDEITETFNDFRVSRLIEILKNAG